MSTEESNTSAMKYFKGHFHDEWTYACKKSTVWWTLGSLLALIIHNITRNAVYYLQPDDPEEFQVLRDLGFEALPDTSDKAWLPEVFFAITFFGGFWVIFAPLFLPFPVLALQLSLRFLVTFLVLSYLRSLAYIVTILPAPADHCNPSDSDYDPPEDAWDVVLFMRPWSGCGDLVFSGHTILLGTAIWFFYKYGRHVFSKGLYTAWLTTILLTGIVTLLAIISAHHHYTVDVIAGVYIVPIWLYLSYVFVPDPFPE